MPTNPFSPPPSPINTKSKQATVRLTNGQDRLLRQHRVRAGLTTQQIVIAALANVIEGFDKA